MPVAALYDIHGNLPALEAVLDHLDREGVEEIVVGGDVLPGPMPAECLDRLLHLDRPVRFLHGNGDREVLERRRGAETDAVPPAFRELLRWTARHIQPAHEAALATWPPTIRMPIAGVGDVLFCHATPRNDTEIFTRLTPADRLAPIFDPVQADLVVCGHTHMQFDRTVGRTRIVNAGSVGMPFGEPGAYWLLLGPGVQLQRTPYDLEAAAARIRETAYPEREAFAAGNVLRPPAEADIMQAYARAEL